MAKPVIKTERPEDLTSPNKGTSKTRRKMNEIKEEDPQAPPQKLQDTQDSHFYHTLQRHSTANNI